MSSPDQTVQDLKDSIVLERETIAIPSVQSSQSLQGSNAVKSSPNPRGNDSNDLFPGANPRPLLPPPVTAPPWPSPLQPQAPGQAPLHRPSFSYNILPPTNVNPAMNQQFKPSSNTSGPAVTESSTINSSAGISASAPSTNIPPPPTINAPSTQITAVPRLDSSTLPVTLPLQPTKVDPSLSRPVFQSIISAPQNLVPAITSNPPNTNHQNFIAFPSLSPQPLPQALWSHPSHPGNAQFSPFLPYPGALPAFAPSPPFLQPPGISGPVSSAGLRGSANELVQAGKDFRPHAALPVGGADRYTESSNKNIDSSKKEESDAWTCHRTDTGVLYYYNSITGKSTYEKPSCFKGEPGKADAHPAPVSWEKLAGTDWTLVTTNDGKKYYYNSKTKVSSWQIPAEIVEQRKNQESDPAKNTSIFTQDPSIEKDSGSAQAVGRDVASSKSVPLILSSALDLIKRKLHDASSPVTSSLLPSVSASVDQAGPGTVDTVVKSQQSESIKDKIKDSNRDSNVSDSSSDSDDEDNGPSKEESFVQFKEMLKERGIAPFSKWEKELPKIIFDPRFKAVQSHSVRRSLFEHYVRTRAEEERKEKRAAQKAMIDGFKQLLDEASEDIDLKTDYQAFKKKWGEDPRFLALGRKEREIFLNERISSLKKLAEEKVQSLRADFMSMLSEESTITASSRWSRVKDAFRDDPRYRYVKREDREAFFNEYIAELKAAEAQVLVAAKAKIEEQEKLKKREEEMRKKKQREEQEMEAVRLRVRRKEAESSYQALLVEKIKDPKASWTESKPKLEKDPQGRAKNPDLSPADMEKLFRDHVKSLYERCARDYRALLSEVITVELAEKTVGEGGKTILNSFSEAKNHLRSDPRYSKLPSRDREAIWLRFADDLRRKLRQDVGGDAKEKGTVAEDSKKRPNTNSDDPPGGSARSSKRPRRRPPP
ncbi:pre-mRNA-processing protein 40C isoform X2 [Wolffia australiana]